jgi:hypothetical protein
VSGESYSLEDVERLLGLHEHPGPTAPRHLTLLDVLSLARSPGGDPYWYLVARASPTATENADWTDVVGPLAPDSELALALFDFEAAVAHLRRASELSTIEYLVLCLTVAGCPPADIAAALRMSRSTVSRTLHGRPRRDREGKVIPGERTGGVVEKVHRAMNGPRPGPGPAPAARRRPPDTPEEASARHWGRL